MRSPWNKKSRGMREVGTRLKGTREVKNNKNEWKLIWNGRYERTKQKRKRRQERKYSPASRYAPSLRSRKNAASNFEYTRRVEGYIIGKGRHLDLFDESLATAFRRKGKCAGKRVGRWKYGSIVAARRGLKMEDGVTKRARDGEEK